MLFYGIWSKRPHRATKDLELCLELAPPDLAALLRYVATWFVRLPFEEDGVVGLTTEASY